jgi:hypothetical protein
MNRGWAAASSRKENLMTMDPSKEDRADEWYKKKSELMEAALGREHDRVMHAIIPYAVGGALDLYYYPHGIPGTAIATKELSDLPGEGSANNVFRCYELVMFTRHPLDLESVRDGRTDFARAHSTINRILNPIARYSADAKLNPHETCEFPADMKHVGGRCLIFDALPCPSAGAAEGFGLLLLIEIFRSEMQFAQRQGGGKLIERLKANGHYPYSDLDRKPVA